MGVVSEVRDWIEAPFVGSVNPMQLFLATGFVLVAILAWTLILYHIRIAAESV